MGFPLSGGAKTHGLRHGNPDLPHSLLNFVPHGLKT